jgi:hypothetical protein
MSAMRTADEVIEDALYTEIRSLLEFCTRIRSSSCGASTLMRRAGCSR